jgi:hypothetical protein
LLTVLMHCLLHFHIFMHLHLASHLGTLGAPREGRDVEPNSKMLLVDLSRRWKDLTSDSTEDARQASVGSKASPGAF